MIAEIPAEQIRAALDEVAELVLCKAEVSGPPIDAVRVASRLGLVVAGDRHLAGRARFVRLGYGAGAEQGTILVGPEERPERLQWAVAHEIGEAMAHRVFRRLGVSPAESVPAAREEVANELAGRILLPGEWFFREAIAWDGDLFELKQCFSTASHELIARRMLEGAIPMIVSVFDQDQITWRRSNQGLRAPRLSALESRVRSIAHRESRTVKSESILSKSAEHEADACRVRCWAVHEPPWRREILRTDLLDVF